MKRFAFFCAYSVSHLRFLIPLVHGLVQAGHEVHLFTEAPSRSEVERAGAHFHDLYRDAAVASVDSRSWPVPCRYVAYAGAYGEQITARVRDVAPDVIVYETFAVSGLVAARALGLPAVNVMPNHAPVPDRMVADIRAHRLLDIAPECEAAVARLREVHGLADAHPLMYYDGVSASLNLCPEPEEFLPAVDRPVFEPLDFLGCLVPDLRAGLGTSPFRSSARHVLTAFGTIIWGALAEEAGRVLGSVARACEAAGDELVIALGGAVIAAPLRAELESRGAVVLEQVDQWAALADTDLLVTHNGLNSTHEAIYHRIPMLSYPFFGDQPALAARCGELGLAVPLVDAWRTPLSPERAARAFAEVEARTPEMTAALEEARTWELRTIADRPRVVERVVALAG